MIKLNARQLRDVTEEEVEEKIKHLQRHPIYFILENVYDTYNIGGLFRLADAIGVEKMYLCGEMETPPNHKIKKASIGTYKIVPWEYKSSAEEAIIELRNKIFNLKFEILNNNLNNNQTIKHSSTPEVKSSSTSPSGVGSIKVIAVEQAANSVPYTEADYSFPVALIFGNETYGVLPETLKLVDQIVEIPMWGINRSLNVIVSAAIVSYWVMELIQNNPEKIGRIGVPQISDRSDISEI